MPPPKNIFHLFVINFLCIASEYESGGTFLLILPMVNHGDDDSVVRYFHSENYSRCFNHLYHCTGSEQKVSNETDRQFFYVIIEV